MFRLALGGDTSPPGGGRRDLHPYYRRFRNERLRFFVFSSAFTSTILTFVLRTFTYRLYPTPSQESRLFHFLDVGRRFYNHALEQRIRFYKETGGSLSQYDQQKDLAQLRAVMPGLANVPSAIERDALRRLHLAFEAFFRRLKAGEKPGFPRFKPFTRWNSFAIGDRFETVIQGNRIRVSGVEGLIRARNVRQLEGRIKQLRIVHKAGKWRVKLVVDSLTEPPAKVPVEFSVGVDVGLESFATFSNGAKIPNPRFAKKSAKKLKLAQRALKNKKRGSKRRRKAIRKIQRIHTRIENQRKSFTHGVSRKLIDGNDLIAVEKLRIKDMVKNGNGRRSLNRGVMDATWGQFFHQLRYKAESAGKTVVEVEPRGTSQECSRCGEIVLKDLSVRTHSCSDCGLVLDRDHNAALNILKRGLKLYREQHPAPPKGIGKDQGGESRCGKRHNSRKEPRRTGKSTR